MNVEEIDGERKIYIDLLMLWNYDPLIFQYYILQIPDALNCFLTNMTRMTR